MGKALLLGSIKGGLEVSSIRIGVRSPVKITGFCKDLGIPVSQSIREAVDKAFIVVLALPATTINPVLFQINQYLDEKCVVISLADNVILKQLEDILSVDRAVIRAMPSYTATVGGGYSLVSCNTACSSDQIRFALDFLRLSGECLEVQEDQIDMISPISSGISAHILYIIEAIIEAGAIRGIPRSQTKDILEQQFISVSKLMSEDSPHIVEHIELICAAGGEGVRRIATLDKLSVRGSIISALN